MAMPLLTRQSVFACKAEGTPGTAEVLSSAEGAYNAFGVSIVPAFANTERPAQGTASQLASIPGAASARITLQTELFGSGTASAPSPAWANTLLKAAAFSVTSNVYTPVTGAAAPVTLTAARYIDGVKKFIAGAVFNFTIRGEFGKAAMIDWEGLGVWQDPADAALITPTYPTVIPPRCVSQTFTIAGTAYKAGMWELSMQNELYLREDVTSASGYSTAIVVDRKPTFRTSVEQSVLSSKDWAAAHKAGTEAAISVVLGSVAGNIITIAIPKAQLMNSPEDEDAGKTLKQSLVFQANRNTAGDDEVSITFS